MIHPDIGNGAAAILVTTNLAEDLGVLAQSLPESVVLLTVGLALALRELQLHYIDVEMGEA